MFNTTLSIVKIDINDKCLVCQWKGADLLQKNHGIKSPVKTGAPGIRALNWVQGDAMAAKKTTKPADERQMFADIEQRAFEIYLERKRNGGQGDEATDWYQAEQEVREKYKK